MPKMSFCGTGILLVTRYESVENETVYTRLF
jgi:hypothetical protein